jgi:hypothetical protein
MRVGGPDRRSRWVGDIRRPIGGAADDHPRTIEETAASDGRNVRLAHPRGPRKEPGRPKRGKVAGRGFSEGGSPGPSNDR